MPFKAQGAEKTGERLFGLPSALSALVRSGLSLFFDWQVWQRRTFNFILFRFSSFLKIQNRSLGGRSFARSFS
jgi:hypothetical protein